MIISGPSGVGKDTIIDALRARDPKGGGDYHYVVTCTTRAPRPGEIPDVSYHFLGRASSTRCTTRGSCWRRTRSTATGTGRHGARWRGPSPRAAT